MKSVVLVALGAVIGYVACKTFARDAGAGGELMLAERAERLVATASTAATAGADALITSIRGASSGPQGLAGLQAKLQPLGSKGCGC